MGKENEFVKAILQFHYSEAERILKDAKINEDEEALKSIFFHVTYINDDEYEGLVPGLSQLHKWRNIPGISLLGFLTYLEDCDWSKSLIYESLISLLRIDLCHITGALELALYFQLKLIQSNYSVENLQMILFYYNHPDFYYYGLIDDKTAVYVAQEVLKIKPDDSEALDIMSEVDFHFGTVSISDTIFADPWGNANISEITANYEELRKYIYQVKYSAAAAILLHPQIDEQTRLDWLVAATIWNDGDQHYGGNLAVYGFLMYLLDEGWDKPRVYRWLVLTLNASDSIGGAYGLALYYCRKLAAEEETLENLRLLLSFTDAPGNFMGRDEAEDVARRILSLDANDAKAREVLELVGGAD